MALPLRVLLLEDRPDDAELVLHELRQAGFAPDWRRVETEADYLAALDPALDLILADYALPQFDALRALELLRARGLTIPFIIVSGTIGEDLAVAAMRQGAADYLLKDRLARLGPAVAHALEQRRILAERRRAEQLLQAGEQRFRALIEHSLEGIALASADGTITYISPSVSRILGYAPADVVGRSGFELIHPDEQAGLPGRLAGLAQQRGHSSLAQCRLRHADGAWHHVEINIHNLLTEPDVQAIVLNYRDITERKRTEEHIQRLNTGLEQHVAERTAELAHTNAGLQSEIAERARLEDQIQAAAARAQALAALSQTLAEASRELQPLFDTIVQQTAQILGDACVLMMLAPDGLSTETVAIGHCNPDAVAFLRTLFFPAYSSTDGFARHVLQNRQALLLPEVSPEAARSWVEPAYWGYLDRFGLASLLVVPLRARPADRDARRRTRPARAAV